MKKQHFTIILAIFIANLFAGSFIYPAAAMVDTTPSLEPLVAPLVTPEPTPTASTQSTEQTTVDTTNTASTTPLISGEVKTGDPINVSAEEILNTVVAPKKETPKVERPSATTSATSTPVIGTTQPTSPTTPTKKLTPPSTPQSTTPVNQTFERTTDGGSNAITPADYYIPLDNLTPESTYALSFLSMILGIMGSVLILREPTESPAWMPGLKTQESLLDS